MGNTFLNGKEIQQEEIPRIVRRRRSVTLKAHSIPDYIPHNLMTMYGNDEICDLASGTASISGKDSKSPTAPESTACDDVNSTEDLEVQEDSPPNSKHDCLEGLDTDSDLDHPTSPHPVGTEMSPAFAGVPGVVASMEPALPISASSVDQTKQAEVEATGERRRGRRSRQRRPSQQSDAVDDPSSPRNESLPLDAATGPITTLMVRNLPHDLLQSDLASEIDQCGFKGLYDFLYMPSTFGTGRGKGYAFINFISPDVAQNFATMWQNTCRFGHYSDRACLNVSAACLQGRDANVARWDTSKMRRIRNPNHRPLVAVIMSDATMSGAPAQQPMGGNIMAEPSSPTLATNAPQLPAQASGGYAVDASVRHVPQANEGQNLVGRWCKLQNLAVTPQANGLWGVIEAYEAPSARYIVRVASDNDHWFLAKLLRENLDLPPVSQSR